MRLREFAPSPRPDGEPSGDFPMTWDQIVDRFRQILTHNLGWRMEAGSGRTASFSKGSMIFIINQYTSPKQIQYYINDGRRQWKGFKFTMWSSITQLLDTVRSLPLKEFAPSPGYGGDDNDEGNVPRYLMHLANLWWNQANPEAQQEVEREIRAGGWTIQQIDDDTVLLHHKEYGITYRISDDNFDPDL